MMRRPRLLNAILLGAALISTAAAQDVDAGHQIAQRWCSACHEVGTAPVRNDVSPSFWSIAQMPSTTKLSLNAFLSTPHHRMPDYSLTRQEIADISGYIVSLKGAKLDDDVKR